MNKTIRKFTYIGMFLGSTMGWYFLGFFQESSDIVSNLFFSIVFGIFGTIVGYKLYKKINGK